MRRAFLRIRLAEADARPLRRSDRLRSALNPSDPCASPGRDDPRAVARARRGPAGRSDRAVPRPHHSEPTATSGSAGRARVRARRLRLGEAGARQRPHPPHPRPRHGAGRGGGPDLQFRRRVRRPRRAEARVPVRRRSAVSGEPLVGVLRYVYWFNLGLAIFNLIPLPPLDGGHFLPYFFPRASWSFLARMQQYGPLILLLLVFSGATRYIMGPLFSLVHGFYLTILAALL